MATANRGMTATETFGTTSPVTGTAPTAVDGTDGMPVQDCDSVCLTVSAPPGQTFSGAGTFDCYVLYPALNRWSRFQAGDFGAPLSGVRDFTYEPVDLLARFKGAYLKWVPTGVTFNGGSTGVVSTIQGTPAGAATKKVYT
jgi:hypothetical protein